ncbi:MAG TPA: prepilin-type N-terminal cleavage/methylation domain-containing protein [Geminicoccaceae bacterium]|nr:prepilin-type N-terminal cleavage/methylation domain-containing protein [Geminicoccaceae bacterium]
MRPRIEPRAAGFTLVEILVALTLLGLLMAALFSGVQLGVRAWETSEERLDESSRLTTVQGFLRERLAEAYLREDFDPRANTPPAFAGEPDRLSFVTLMPEHLGGGFQRMVLAVTAADERSDLAVAWWPAELDGTAVDPDSVRRRALLADVAELRLAYFGSVGRDEPPAWHEVWAQPVLPRLVRVQLRFSDQDGRSWPDLIVRPMIDGQPY